MKFVIVFCLLSVNFSSAHVINQPTVQQNEINLGLFIIVFPSEPNTKVSIKIPSPEAISALLKQYTDNLSNNNDLVTFFKVPSTSSSVEPPNNNQNIHNPRYLDSPRRPETYIASSEKDPDIEKTKSQSRSGKICPDSSQEDFDPKTHPNWRLVNDETCGQNVEDRIVGGINASLGQFPWIARIGYKEDDEKEIFYKCGGVLITKRHVLTAAHCIVDLPPEFKVAAVQLGEYDTTKKIDCVDDECADPVQNFQIEKIEAHDQYDNTRFTHDIGLVTLTETVKFTNWITPICLPVGPLLTKSLTGAKVDIAGWGFYDTMLKEQSKILQTVKLPVLDPDICVNKFKRFHINITRQLCVGGDVGKDSCNGDSGGPLMKVEAGDEGPRFFLFGVVSFGATYCGLNANPAVYTKVTHYMKWILDRLDD